MISRCFEEFECAGEAFPAAFAEGGGGEESYADGRRAALSGELYTGRDDLALNAVVRRVSDGFEFRVASFPMKSDRRAYSQFIVYKVVML